MPEAEHVKMLHAGRRQWNAVRPQGRGTPCRAAMTTATEWVTAEPMLPLGLRLSSLRRDPALRLQLHEARAGDEAYRTSRAGSPSSW
jgi:hypothetical protein